MYYGNPNVNITAIDTSGGIACSRTSGTTPCFIQVSASAIAATGTSVPYEDLEYCWNFGDLSGTETFANPGVRGGTANANTAQIGPEAGYVYRLPGTYTVTLTIRGRQASGGYITTTVTRQITVAAFSASAGYSEIYVDSAAPAGGTGTAYSPFNSIADINRFVASGRNKQVWIKKGSTFAGGAAINIGGAGNATGTVSGLRIGAYGSGAAPIVEVTSGSGIGAIHTAGGGGGTPANKTDIVVSGITFLGSGTYTGSVVYFQFTEAGGANANIYLDNCTCSATADGARPVMMMASTPAALANWGCWNCTLTSLASPTTGTSGMFSQGQSWHMFVGGSITGGSPASAQQHHWYPIVRTHLLANWINFGLGTGRNFCINLDWDRVGSVLEYAEFASISECNAYGTDRFHDASDSDNDVSKVNWRNVVCQLNKIHDLRSSGVVMFYNCISYTHRYNQVWNCNGGIYFGPSPRLNNLMLARFYGNQIYRTNGVDEILWMPGMTQPQTITDETYQCTQISGRHIAISFSAQARATINRNQWYSANATTSTLQFRDVELAKTFEQLQAAGLDLAGRVANPGWLDPANGNFKR